MVGHILEKAVRGEVGVWVFLVLYKNSDFNIIFLKTTNNFYLLYFSSFIINIINY